MRTRVSDAGFNIDPESIRRERSLRGLWLGRGAMNLPNVTGVVLTLNEEEHLTDCLVSLLQITERILVLDSGSSDLTGEIAQAAGARVVVHPFVGYASQRNVALDLVETEWTLFLDADERISPDGAQEIAHLLEDADADVAACWMPRRNLFFGRALRGGGWWPDHQSRLLRTPKVRYDEERQVHEVAVIDGRSVTLREPLIHLNYATRREFLRKQRQYTEQRVQQSLAHGTIPRRRACAAGPVREFHRRFIALAGYRDGLTGLFLALVLAYEEWRACVLIRRKQCGDG
jgi:glycosyltransferase involved in cell wall biosynthesis